MVFAIILQWAATIAGLGSAIVWGCSGYAGLSYDRYKAKQIKAAQKKSVTPNLSAVVLNGTVMGSGNPAFLNAIAALLAAAAVLSQTMLPWVQATVAPCSTSYPSRSHEVDR